MSVLARELDSYQRAVDIYNRHNRAYNKQVEGFNATIYHDAKGDAAGLVNGQWTTNAPDDKTGLALYTDPNTGQRVLRTPQGTTDVQANANPAGRGALAFMPGAGGGNVPLTSYATMVQDGYVGQRFPAGISGSVTLQKPVFTDAPTPLGPFDRDKVDPTLAELHRARMPGMADIEAGLIGEAMRGSGLKSGVHIRHKTVEVGQPVLGQPSAPPPMTQPHGSTVATVEAPDPYDPYTRVQAPSRVAAPQTV